MSVQVKLGIVFALMALVCANPASAQTPLADPTASGPIRGTVVDASGAVVAGVRVKLTREDQSPAQETLSGDDGQFFFANLAPGPFQLAVTSEGFAPQTASGTLHAGETYLVPRIALSVSAVVTEVQVGLSRTEVATEEVKDIELQRVFAIIPNFYVSYVRNPAPLTAKEKFNIAWKTTIDPVSFVIVGAIAGVEQSQNAFSGYGHGAQGYGQRYGAAFADATAGIFIGSAVLPSLLKQDPRYFYQGTGSKRSRILHAIASSVICEGDNGRTQVNYSNIIGNFAAGGISNLYYPAKDRNGAGLTLGNGLIGIGASSAASLFQEFVFKKFTRTARNPFPGNPDPEPIATRR